ncbi:hypothetical protein [Undibacterium curvum]|uniref:hypothetical protein n=1 Tax=Undibacterium curvum TaxID=2762294 RepID=UPI003D0FA965
MPHGKWKKKASLSERSEFRRFPILRDAQIVPTRSAAPEGRSLQRRLLLLTFLGEARKVSGCRATPGLALRSDIVLDIENDRNPDDIWLRLNTAPIGLSAIFPPEIHLPHASITMFIFVFEHFLFR